MKICVNNKQIKCNNNKPVFGEIQKSSSTDCP